MRELHEQLWAWVTEDKEGRINLIGAGFPGLGQMPLISHSREAVMKLESFAKTHGMALDQPVWLRRYVLAEDYGRVTAVLGPRALPASDF